MYALRQIVLLNLVLLSTPVFSQLTHENVRNGELIIQLSPSAQLSSVNNFYRRKSGSTTKLLSKHLQVYKLTFPPSIDIAAVKEQLEADERIIQVQYNHSLIRRGGTTTPNDPFFKDQWYLERIGAPEIWDRTTGGVTPCGDTIVIAVFDFGLDVDHEDMQGQIWKNKAEVANNSFDDDNNGYVDDYLGLNLDTGNDQHAIDPNYHGTEVASVIGAQSNNELGITSLNWQVQMMIISSVDKTEALAIEAFDYILDQRIKYNQSAGAEGAYVVAVNNSWGREGFFEEDFPILCGMFDELGKAGIISVGSTENDQVNTDVFGDIPSDCSSDFLIVVTNTDENDELAIGGFGKQNVDLGAPGESIRVVARDNSYGFDSGTSFAAPLVTGAVGLLYALPEATFCDNAQLSLEDALRDLKRFILDGVTPVNDLADRTVSGGRLDLSKSAELVTSDRDPSISPIKVFPNPTRGLFELDIDAAHGALRFEIYDALGRYVRPAQFLAQGIKVTIDGSSWPSGAYFVQINDRHQTSVVKVVKI